MTKEELVKQAEARWEKEQLVKQAEAKWQSEQAPKSGALDTAEAFVGPMASQLTMGLSEPIAAGTSAVTGLVTEAALDPNKGFLDGLSEIPGKFSEEYARQVGRSKKVQEAHPTASLAGELAGAISPVGAGAAAFKGGRFLGMGLGGSGRVGQVLGAGLGAGAQEGGREIVREIGNVGEDTDAGVTALKTTAAFEAALQTAGVAGKAVKVAGRKLLSAMSRVPEESISYFLKNVSEVNGAKSIEEIKDLVDDSVGKIRQSVVDGEMEVKEAEKAYEAYVDILKDKANISKEAARDSMQTAKMQFESAMRERADILKFSRAPVELRSQVKSAMDDLKDKIVAESDNAGKMLIKEAGNFNRDEFISIAQNEQKALKTGKGFASESDEAAYSALQSTIDRWKSLPEGISPQMANQIRKSFQRDTQFNNKIAQFAGSPAEASINAVYGGIRDLLGSKSPSFDKHMKEVVAPIAKLHSGASPFFNQESRIESSLANIAGPAKQGVRDKLAAIGQATGNDFETPINQFLQTQALKQSAVAKKSFIEGVPEKGQALKAQYAYQAAAQQAEKEAILKQAQQSEFLAQLQRKQQALNEAKAELEPFKSWTESTTEAKIKRLSGVGNINDRRKLAELSQVDDVAFDAMIKNGAVKADFMRDNTMGSAYQNIFALAGTGLIGGVLQGDLGTGALSGIGAATLAAMATKYGPRGAKKMLEGVAKIQGMPTVRKINELAMDPILKDELRTQLQQAVGAMSTRDRDVVFDPEERVSVIQDLQKDNTLPSMTKARMVSMMEKEGKLEEPNLYVFGSTKTRPVLEPVRNPLRSEPPDVLKDLSSFQRGKKVEKY